MGALITIKHAYHHIGKGGGRDDYIRTDVGTRWEFEQMM